jgi:lipopolysaccharide transport system ATP-binding protein
MSEIAISVQNLGKRYRLGIRGQRQDTLLGALSAWVRSPLENYRQLRRLSQFDDEDGDDVLWALRGASFEVKQGEVIGIIGRNGAGKSTLLKILARITEPTTGRVVLNGRVASLLEVGTGFHPELTGRENVYLNGTVLGMRKREVDQKFDEIVDFSGIERFIDTPIKRYSSGMKVRLAFAVAAHLEPEILLVDEVLAVGDAQFQRKCIGKLHTIASGGRTVLFVSHDMSAIIGLCSRTLVVQSGAIVFDGVTTDAVPLYLGDGAAESTTNADVLAAARPAGDIRFVSLVVEDEVFGPGNRIRCGQPFRVSIGYESASPRDLAVVSVSISFKDHFGRLLGTAATHFTGEDYGRIPPVGEFTCEFPELPFAPGIYGVQLWCSVGGETSDKIEHDLNVEVVNYAVSDLVKLPNPRKHGSILLTGYSWSSVECGGAASKADVGGAEPGLGPRDPEYRGLATGT